MPFLSSSSSISRLWRRMDADARSCCVSFLAFAMVSPPSGVWVELTNHYRRGGSCFERSWSSGSQALDVAVQVAEFVAESGGQFKMKALCRLEHLELQGDHESL